jgi:hypothetical protein
MAVKYGGPPLPEPREGQAIDASAKPLPEAGEPEDG